MISEYFLIIYTFQNISQCVRLTYNFGSLGAPAICTTPCNMKSESPLARTDPSLRDPIVQVFANRFLDTNTRWFGFDNFKFASLDWRVTCNSPMPIKFISGHSNGGEYLIIVNWCTIWIASSQNTKRYFNLVRINKTQFWLYTLLGCIWKKKVCWVLLELWEIYIFSGRNYRQWNIFNRSVLFLAVLVCYKNYNGQNNYRRRTSCFRM